jgi:hypothetical protein
MIVYVHMDHDQVLGVYSTREKAEEGAAAMDYPVAVCRIEEHVVNEVLDDE